MSREFRFVPHVIAVGLFVTHLSFVETFGWSQDTQTDSTIQTPERVVPWTTSRITGSPEKPVPYVMERVWEGISLVLPTEMIPVPNSDRWIVTQLDGQIVSFSTDADADQVDLVIDLAEQHADLWQVLGIVFHPTEPVCFVTYAVKGQTSGETRLARFEISNSEIPTLDPQSESILATWSSGGHKGGCMKFGVDGYMYLAIGDGTPPNPPDAMRTGQDLSDIQSAILRIDVNRTEGDLPYGIPDDNPFVAMEGARGEVWAYGFRNPWKFCFDPDNETIWAGDVGWEMMEMVYRVEKAGNYGWSIMEGSQPVHPNDPRGPTPIQPPIVEHSHIEARSVTGGYFYEHDRLSELKGAYIYGDYMTGKIWALRHDSQKLTWHEEIADTPLQIITFAHDPTGEVFVVGYDGSIHRLISNPQSEANVDFPRKLSDTGLFASTEDHVPANGVVPYAITARHWADHTTSEQFLGLPGTSQLSVFADENWEVGQNTGHFAFPQDAVLAKTVFLEMKAGDPASRRRIETQVLHRHGDEWNAYNYIWNDEQTDASLAENIGSDQTFRVDDPDAPGGFREQVWHHSSRDECLLCHIWRAGTIHGFKLEQLDQPRADSAADGQLPAMAQLGLFREELPRLAQRQISPDDTNANLGERARSYLHLNCAHCHRRGGGGTAAFDIQQHLSLAETDLLDAPPTQGNFGIEDAKIVAPGDPYHSILYYRMAKLGRGRMPHFGSNVVDARGVQLIHDWIASLNSDRDAQANRSSLAKLQNDAKLNEDQARPLIEQLLSTTSGALLLSSVMAVDEFPESYQTLTLQLASRHVDSQVADLFERFLPADQRVKRLGTVIDVPALLAAEGDIDRGEQLFFEASGVTCRNCHRIGQRGAAVGPELTSVGRKYELQEILDNILVPSKVFEPKYASYLIQTIDGRIVSGLLAEQSEQELLLKDANAKDIRVARDDVEVMQMQQKSIMPELLFRDLTEQQAADLLAFLHAQKGPDEWLRKSHEIPYTKASIEIDGKLTESAWQQAPSVGPFEFPWWHEGDPVKQQTEVKVLWNDEYLYVSFVCQDHNVLAERTERDSMVYRDDCVEVFGSPRIDKPDWYFNLEINANGAILDNFRPYGVAPEQHGWNPDGILVGTSVQGTINDESDVDQSWIMEMAIPFAIYAEIMPHNPPQIGDRWRLNFHRLEDNMAIKSQWSPGDRNRTIFHVPQYFGEVTFGKALDASP